jgi:hypothetical protein
MNILKHFNRWLTPEEETQLKDPTRRVFCFLGMATLASLALPKVLDNGPWYLPPGWAHSIGPTLADPATYSGTWLMMPRVSYPNPQQWEVKRVRQALNRLHSALPPQ